MLFYVQNLLGTGHIRRAGLLVQAMRIAGLEVNLVSGGVPQKQGALVKPDVQLPPLRALDDSFRVLVDEAGNEIDTEWKRNRCQFLISEFHRLQPDVVIIESFPFGRRKLKFELVPLLDEIRRSLRSTVTICSVRDIVQARSPARINETVKWLQTRFNHVMVHGDPGLVRFDESFSASREIEPLIHYTGYVASASDQRRANKHRQEIIVSAGGGAVGYTLLKTAIQARHMSKLDGHLWRILVGPGMGDSMFSDLKASASSGSGILVERNRDDFGTLLKHCTLSVSQCGYNTAMDVLQSGTRALMVPYTGQGETEQRLRAVKLEQRGLISALPESKLAPRTLAAKIDLIASGSKPGPVKLDLDGATQTAQFVVDAWQRLINTGQREGV